MWYDIIVSYKIFDESYTLELSQKHLELIKNIIKSDKKYQGNEDLYDDFFNETCNRSLSIIETMGDSDALEAYLKKIASTAIVVVLKNMDRVRRTHNAYVNNDKIVKNDNTDKTSEIQPFEVNYNFINFDTTPEKIAEQKDLLQSVYDSIIITHSQHIEKQYLELYELRYIEGKKQSEIAQALNISQSQVSKRLFELMQSVKKYITDTK